MSNRDTTPARCAVIKREAEQCFARVYAKWRSRVGTPQYDHGAANRETMQSWLAAWVPVSQNAARNLQPIWSQPSEKAVTFEDAVTRSQGRFADLLEDLTLEAPQQVAA